MDKKSKIESVLSSVIDEFGSFDLDPDGILDVYDEKPAYLLAHRHEYLRTLKDVVSFSERHPVNQILEIGMFFGVVSICLSRLGFHVCATDTPEYINMPEQRARFDKQGVEVAPVRLEDYVLPFEDDRFDVIIMCEVLEHLNFNPLPLIKEINRVGSQDSLFYLSLPNLAQIRSRLKLIRGKSILASIQSYFDQLDPNMLEICNGHWREYTATEIREMLVRMGYEIEDQYFFGLSETLDQRGLRKKLAKMVYKIFPSFKENQTTLATKKKRTDIVFRIPSTVHRTLKKL